MSFSNTTGLSDPTTAAGFQGLLQTASFRGVPFKVLEQRVRIGRRLAVHNYPFVDGGWPEDMGRALRTYSFTGYLIGDLAPVMQLALKTILEQKGPGILIHPTVGAVQVAVLSAGTAVNYQRMRVIAVEMEFIEANSQFFPATVIATAVSLALFAASALAGLGSDFGDVAGPAAAVGPPVTAEGAAVVTGFGDAVESAAGDPAAILGMATALTPPDDQTYGRYAFGSASTPLPAGTTMDDLTAQLATQRAEIETQMQTALETATAYTTADDMVGALAAPCETLRAAFHDPADQIRVLTALCGFSFADTTTGHGSMAAAKVAMRDAMAAACRRAALVSLVRASADYLPRSYDDAAALRESLAAALDVEIEAAGDAFLDETYQALKKLRQAMVLDLTNRGGSLPTLMTVNLAANLPALAVAQLLYRDASRSDQLIAEADVIHPAFMPTNFKALSR